MKQILGILVLSMVAAIGSGTAYAATNAVPEIIESPTAYYINPDNNRYYIGKVPIPEITAIDAENMVSTNCKTPDGLSYWGGGSYKYDIGTYKIECYVTDGTHQVPFSYDLVITNERRTGYEYPRQSSASVSIPHWVDAHAERYCEDRMSTKQILAIYNYLDRYEILDLDWNGLDSNSVYSLDLKRITCDWTDGNITDEIYQNELRKLKDMTCE